jgi:hypothetical protein
MICVICRLVSDDRAAVVMLDAVRREYPKDLRHSMRGPDDRPLPIERTGF